MTTLLLIRNKRTLVYRVLLSFYLLFYFYRLGNSSIKSGVPLKLWPWNCGC